jgi:hypothetical protein
MLNWVAGIALTGCLLISSFAFGAPCEDLAKLLTEPTGQDFTVKFVSASGAKTQLDGKFQLEREKRFNVSASQKSVSYLVEEGGLLKEKTLGLAYKDQNELLAKIIQWKPETPGFQFCPLGQCDRIYHGPWTFDRTFINPEYKLGPVIATIYGGDTWRDDAAALSGEVDYFVNSQQEISQYFDTENEALLNGGVALRIKSWYPTTAKIFDEKTLIARTMTLKREVGAQSGFHIRQEWQVKIPLDMPEADLVHLAFALLKKAGVKIKEPLQISRNIFNKRSGIKWRFGNQHIGFLTVDAYRLLKDSEEKFHSQVEIELFSEEGAISEFQKNPKLFEDFFEEMRKWMSAEDASSAPKVKGVLLSSSRAATEIKDPKNAERLFATVNDLQVSGLEVRALTKDETGRDILVHFDLPKQYRLESFLEVTMKIENGSLFVRESAQSPWIELARKTGRKAQIRRQIKNDFAEADEFEVIRPGMLKY